MFLPGESQGRGAWWAAVSGVSQSWTRLKRLSSSSSNNEEVLPPMKQKHKFLLWFIITFNNYRRICVFSFICLKVLEYQRSFLKFTFFSVLLFNNLYLDYRSLMPILLIKASSHLHFKMYHLSHTDSKQLSFSSIGTFRPTDKTTSIDRLIFSLWNWNLCIFCLYLTSKY